MAVLNPTDHSWVGSEVGLVLKTATVASATAVAGADGRKVMKAGSLITDTKLGKVLLWNDIDVTEGDRIVSVMYAGYYIDSKLPTSVATAKEDLAGHGLFAIVL
jgi:hypothetical protein